MPKDQIPGFLLTLTYIPECLRGHARDFMEDAAEVCLVFKSHLMRDSPNILRRIQQGMFCMQDAVAV